MKLIQGGGDPDAHLHSRIRPNCDWCGAPLKGRMPKPYWVAFTARRECDEHGHEVPENPFRMYLCKEHREAMTAAFDRAVRRERDRTIIGQRIFSDTPPMKPL